MPQRAPAGLGLSARSSCAYDPSSDGPCQAGTSARLAALASLQARALGGPNQRLRPHVPRRRPKKPPRRAAAPVCHPPRGSRRVYLAFLSPRIRVRHWGDEGQGKGAEAGGGGSCGGRCRCKRSPALSRSGCGNPAATAATRTAELQPAGDPVPAGSEVKPAWPSNSAPPGPPPPRPITAGSAPARAGPRRAREQAPPRRGPRAAGACRLRQVTGEGGPAGFPAVCARRPPRRVYPGDFGLRAAACAPILHPERARPSPFAPGRHLAQRNLGGARGTLLRAQPGRGRRWKASGGAPASLFGGASQRQTEGPGSVQGWALALDCPFQEFMASGGPRSARCSSAAPRAGLFCAAFFCTY